MLAPDGNKRGSVAVGYVAIGIAGNPDEGTGDIEKFSVKENFRKILKVSHFYLEFSCNKNHDKITHSHRIFSEFSGSYRI